ncbi:uncharacterized protein LOC144344651 [Saccoglossus kowalevskii]
MGNAGEMSQAGYDIHGTPRSFNPGRLNAPPRGSHRGRLLNRPYPRNFTQRHVSPPRAGSYNRQYHHMSKSAYGKRGPQRGFHSTHDNHRGKYADHPSPSHVSQRPASPPPAGSTGTHSANRGRGRRGKSATRPSGRRHRGRATRP